MIITIPLRPGVTLANVRYRYIVQGAEQPEQNSGISQPDSNFPIFVFNVSPPAGTNEVLAYDVTDLTNWNVAQYTLAFPATATPVIPPVIAAGRLATFRSVYESIARRLGYNPRQHGEPKEDVAQNILQHINDRVLYFWPIADWPDINLVEWRAFRTVWTSSLQVLQGQDVYYMGDGITPPLASVDPPSTYPGPNEGYYNCTAQPPVGTPPTNTNYFTIYGGATLPSLADRFIAYNQQNQNVIGEILSVYPQNPRKVTYARIYKQAPSSHGTDIQGTANIVWIRYRIPASQFTLQPFTPGFTTVGGSYYDPVSGNCFFSTLAPTLPGGFPANQSFSDTLIPFPFFLRGCVVADAYSDTLRETAMENQVRDRLADKAEIESMNYLQRELDNLAAQGHREYYPAFPSRRRYHRGIDIQPGAISQEQFVGFPVITEGGQ